MKLFVPANMILIEVLKHFFPESSLTTLKSWVKEGRITVDGGSAKDTRQALTVGQQIELIAKARYIEGNLQLLYEDSDFIIIDKPCGILSVATAFDKTKTAHAYLKKHCKPLNVYVVHRLDQETSGVMMFVLKENFYREMKKIFEKHEIDRVYYAIVEGHVQPSKGTWQSYLYEDANYNVHSTPFEEGGALAITHYEVKSASPMYSLLKIQLETGRKNQIRVHCQQAGYPIVGDKKYGSNKNPLKRLGLHAHKLAFVHPFTQKKWYLLPLYPKFFQKPFKTNS